MTPARLITLNLIEQIISQTIRVSAKIANGNLDCKKEPKVRWDFRRSRRSVEESAARRVSLTHGDWSPKNFLVGGDQVMAIDFEVIHFGDPSFDSAFLLNHLLLKSFYRPQWRESYAEAAAASS